MTYLIVDYVVKEAGAETAIARVYSTLGEARDAIRDLKDGQYDVLKLTNATPYEVKRVTEVKVSGGERRKRNG